MVEIVISGRKRREAWWDFWRAEEVVLKNSRGIGNATLSRTGAGGCCLYVNVLCRSNSRVRGEHPGLAASLRDHDKLIVRFQKDLLASYWHVHICRCTSLTSPSPWPPCGCVGGGCLSIAPSTLPTSHSPLVVVWWFGECVVILRVCFEAPLLSLLGWLYVVKRVVKDSLPLVWCGVSFALG